MKIENSWYAVFHFVSLRIKFINVKEKFALSLYRGYNKTMRSVVRTVAGGGCNRLVHLPPMAPKRVFSLFYNRALYTGIKIKLKMEFSKLFLHKNAHCTVCTVCMLTKFWFSSVFVFIIF